MFLINKKLSLFNPYLWKCITYSPYDYILKFLFFSSQFFKFVISTLIIFENSRQHTAENYLLG